MLILPAITFVLWRLKFPPFLVLTGAAFFYGILSGMHETAVTYATQGAGKIFTQLAVPIFCGSIIAQVIRQANYGEKIVADIERISGRPALSSGIAGYLLSIPLMCCITAYVVMIPLVENLKTDEAVRKKCFYMAAIGSTLSFVLLYPLPVLYSIASSLEIQNAVSFNKITLPISVLLLLAGYGILWRRQFHTDRWEGKSVSGHLSRTAWLPIILPVLLLGLGYTFRELDILANINITMLIATVFSVLLLKKDQKNTVFEKGTRNAGIILLDLCGAGAFGGVIAASTFADDAYRLLEGSIPVILLPFILAVLIQTAQGSRVVTAIVTSSIISGNASMMQLSILPLMLMMAAGTLIFSYVTDPYFWLIRRTTGDTVKEVVYSYTLPLASLGILLLMGGLILDIFLF